MAKPPLVVHAIHQLAMGGMENGLVNLINHTPPERYRHAVLCLTNATEFRERITAPGVEIIALHKRPHGQDPKAQYRAYQALRRLRPSILHARNLTGLDAQLPGFCARVPVRIQGEHGRDLHDPDGTNRRFILLKQLHRPFIHHWATVSADLAEYVREQVGVAPAHVTQIMNGVDTTRFAPHGTLPAAYEVKEGAVVFGTVGRLQDVKDQVRLIEAMALLPALSPHAHKARLLLVGDGPMHERLVNAASEAGLADRVQFAGKQNDVPAWIRAMSVFCLPSRAEGISNTLLEAMACGRPTIATRVGGSVELVVEGETGALIPHSDSAALASAMARYLNTPGLIAAHSQAARTRAVAEFSLERMVGRYLGLYDRLLGV